MSFLSDLFESTLEVPGKFAEVLAHGGPIEAFLLAMGALLVGVPMAVFGLLVLGAAIDLVVPDSIRETHP